MLLANVTANIICHLELNCLTAVILKHYKYQSEKADFPTGTREIFSLNMLGAQPLSYSVSSTSVTRVRNMPAHMNGMNTKMNMLSVFSIFKSFVRS